MPPLPGFSDNPFRTHSDFKTACISLLRALKPYQSAGGARIKLPLATGTHFDETAAQLEGFARPLWAIGALIHGNALTPEETNELVEPYVRGMANGTDPQHSEYWGPVVQRDQRMVEMEIISFALLVAPEMLYRSQSAKTQENIRNWLSTLNGKDFPTTNWLWFRVMTNLALVKVCGVPYEELKSAMDEDFGKMEMFYLNDGWAADGLWSDEGRQADYYSGSFAIQFSQLLYAKMASDLDPERCSTFKERARNFASSFWRYFDRNGAAIPFGRSLTYRFAFAGFWSAAAFAEVELPEPVNNWGGVKCLLLRHFRWWAAKHDIFNADGTLTIGFTYPNMYLSEDYNSPQSPYWAMKSFVALGLPDQHTFWICSENSDFMDSFPHQITAVKPPMQIVCQTANHHFLLSAGQFCPWPLKATEAKYGKFAYSSHFGFSVPTGPLLQQMAPDSTLALSKDGGETWRVPWKVEKFSFGMAIVINLNSTSRTSILCCTWKPWKDVNVEVRTMLIPPCDPWPDWHVRLHKIINNGSQDLTILARQGGFAIQGRGDLKGEMLPSYTTIDQFVADRSKPGIYSEGAISDVYHGALIRSNAGGSGIRALGIQDTETTSVEQHTEHEILKPDANTNLIWQRTLIPTIKSQFGPFSSGDSVVFGSAVYATANAQPASRFAIQDSWNNPPDISLKKEKLEPSHKISKQALIVVTEEI